MNRREGSFGGKHRISAVSNCQRRLHVEHRIIEGSVPAAKRDCINPQNRWLALTEKLASARIARLGPP